MKAITLWQPYAQLIAVGVKTIETRTHNRFRSLAGSRIAIHAASREPPSTERRAIWYKLRELGIASDNHVIWHWLSIPPLGAIVCTVRVASFGELTQKKHAVAACCDIARNHFGLFLEELRRLEKPIPYKGARGIWTVPDELIPETAR